WSPVLDQFRQSGTAGLQSDAARLVLSNPFNFIDCLIRPPPGGPRSSDVIAAEPSPAPRCDRRRLGDWTIAPAIVHFATLQRLRAFDAHIALQRRKRQSRHLPPIPPCTAAPNRSVTRLIRIDGRPNDG